MIDKLIKCNALLKELGQRNFIVDFPDKNLDYSEVYEKITKLVDVKDRKVRVFFEKDMLHLTYVVFVPSEGVGIRSFELSIGDATYNVRGVPRAPMGNQNPDVDVGQLPIDEQFLHNMHYELVKKYKDKLAKEILDEMVEARLKEASFV